MLFVHLVEIENEVRLVRDLESLLPPAQALRLVLLELLEELRQTRYFSMEMKVYFANGI